MKESLLCIDIYLFNKKTFLVKSALEVSGSIITGTISYPLVSTPAASNIVNERRTRDPVPPIPKIYNFAI